MATNVEVLKKQLPGFRGDAWLVKKNDEYFVVSGTIAFDTGWEVLVFPADSEGNVTDWLEVAGGRAISHEDAIDELSEL